MNNGSRLIRAFMVFGLLVSGFTGCDSLTDGMQIYFGNLHSHTKYSDGKGTPAEVLEWARDEVGYDFYAITDHCEFLSKSEWNDIADEVDYFNETNVFAALRGFEYSHATDGHINVFDTGSYVSSIWMFTLPWFYYWLDKKDGIGQFNHPGIAWEFGTFWNFKYYNKVYDNMVAVETGNSGDGNNDKTYYDYYIMALDKGWRVAPVNNQDNHKLSTNCHRTAIIAAELTPDSILDALKNRRAYSTDDPDMEVWFKLGDAWMGSIVETSSSTAQFTIAVRDNEAITKLELITNNGAVAASKSYSGGETEILWAPVVEVVNGDYFFVRVTESNTLDNDSDVQIALTAPIWIRQ
ncbi:MAG: CehA/McbA family metallohydrolase [bacterium]|nr:CehA/McbA family metallohydrolase [bacterium]